MFKLSEKIENLGFNVDTLSAGLASALHRAVGNAAQMAQGEWIRLAQARLHSSRSMYVNGLRQAESFQATVVAGSPVFTISLVGSMPNNIEHGMSSFDMKMVRPGWLGSPKAKIAADGHRYIRIPFRHSTSSTSNIAYSGKARAANMKQELKQTVKSYGLDRMLRTASGNVRTGPVARVPNNATDVHRFLRGLTRIQEAFNSTTASGQQRGAASLMTWRVLSEKSAEDAWVHPGLPGVRLLDEVSRWTDRELDRVIEEVMGAA
jgi:hypothetical protein